MIVHCFPTRTSPPLSVSSHRKPFAPPASTIRTSMIVTRLLTKGRRLSPEQPQIPSFPTPSLRSITTDTPKPPTMSQEPSLRPKRLKLRRDSSKRYSRPWLHHCQNAWTIASVPQRKLPRPCYVLKHLATSHPSFKPTTTPPYPIFPLLLRLPISTKPQSMIATNRQDSIRRSTRPRYLHPQVSSRHHS
jgi:hypothetical protein